MPTGMSIGEERQAMRDSFQERAIKFLADSYGDDPFKIYPAVDGFATELDLDPEELIHMPARVEAHRAIKTVMAERLNGVPRYLYIGGAYQRTEAVPAEILAQLRKQAEAVASGFLRRDQWLAELEADKTGESLDTLVKQRKDAIRDLEDSFTAA
jgi:hypothetical protein